MDRPFIEYRLMRTGPSSFLILRGGEFVTMFVGDHAEAEAEVERYESDEARSRLAIISGRPEALCEVGWHRRTQASEPDEADRFPRELPDPLYFRFAARIDEAGGTLVFRVAEEPFLYAARTVKTLGSVRPWHCSECGEDIPEDSGR